MNGFDASAALETLPWAAAVIAALLAATFAVAKRAGKHSVIDATWGLLFAGVAVVAFIRSDGSGELTRRWLLLVLPVVWGGRLAGHIARRNRGKPEDPRYERLMAKASGNPDLYALRSVYLLQGAIAFVVASPIVVGVFETGGVGVLTWVGVAMWAVGMLFEGVGDAQLAAFRRKPANRGKVMDSGLWRYTRHPNYFGDACVWWGVFLIAADEWPGLLTGYAPIVMTLLLTKGSGARLLDQHMSRRPGWADYASRTSGFLPLPPRRNARHRRSDEAAGQL